MKLIHTADWHLGRTLHKLSLERFQEDFLDHIVELTRFEEPDALLLAGDVYDRAIAPTTSIRMFEDVLQRLTELTRVIVIPGNHDSATRLGFGSALFRDNLQFFSQTSRVGEPIVVQTDSELLNVYPVPFLEPDTARLTLADTVDDDGVLTKLTRSHQAVMEGALRRIDSDLQNRKGPAIAMIHAFIAGSATSDSERDISVGGAQSVTTETFVTMGSEQRRSRGLSYVAAGHLHRPQQFETDGPIIRYSGSPQPFSFSEATDHKSTTVLTIENEVVSVETVDVPQPYSLHQRTGTIDELITDVPDWAKTGYAHLEITDTVRPEHMYERIKAVYPNALLIRHTPPASTQQATYAQVDRKSPQDLAREFFELALGREVSNIEADIIDKTWSQVLDEEVH
ncbi:MAG: exonuclease SbcCD subunit D [Actinomycetaceae bacterium]|nr:exonuclease SbcCD subunit D [Actinomycetaceae bacterium]